MCLEQPLPKYQLSFEDFFTKEYPTKSSFLTHIFLVFSFFLCHMVSASHIFLHSSLSSYSNILDECALWPHNNDILESTSMFFQILYHSSCLPSINNTRVLYGLFFHNESILGLVFYVFSSPCYASLLYIFEHLIERNLLKLCLSWLLMSLFQSSYYIESHLFFQ